MFLLPLNSRNLYSQHKVFYTVLKGSDGHPLGTVYTSMSTLITVETAEQLFQH